MTKENKPRADKYEGKLIVKGAFIDVINASLKLAKNAPPKKAVKKKG